MPWGEGVRAELSFAPHDRYYKLNVEVEGALPRTGCADHDLYLYFKDTGYLTLREVDPISPIDVVSMRWHSAYGLDQRQVVLLAIYPMARLRLDPWTGNAGRWLEPTGADRSLMMAAQLRLGLDGSIIA